MCLPHGMFHSRPQSHSALATSNTIGVPRRQSCAKEKSSGVENGYVLEPTDICACTDQIPKGEKKIQPEAVPLDTLPERRTMTIHPEISARGSLTPAGDGSKLLSDTCPPGGREKTAPRPYETNPFPRQLSSTLLL